MKSISYFKSALFLSRKSLIRGNQWQLALIIIVISLSFISLLLTPSIMAGVVKSLDNQQINALSGNIVIGPLSNKAYLNNIEETQIQILHTSGVVGVSTRLISSAFIEYKWLDTQSPSDISKSGTWQVVGINPQRDATVTTIHNQMIQGSYLDAHDVDSIILGVEIAGGPMSQNEQYRTLGGVAIGDKVRLTYTNGIRKEYMVKGVFRTREGMADRMALVNREELVSVLSDQVSADSANQIIIKTTPSYDENIVIAEIKASGIHGEIRSWKEYGGSAGGVVSSFNAIASLISAIGIVVAAVVMFIVIYINVLHRKRQIGILRAIGINRRIVIYSYLFQAVFYAFTGMSIGGLVFFFAIIPYFNANPIDLPIGLVSLSVNPETIQSGIIGIVLAAIFAGVIPTLSIIRHSIIKAIWGD
jgi:putative ABC transport system permease protein